MSEDIYADVDDGDALQQRTLDELTNLATEMLEAQAAVARSKKALKVLEVNVQDLEQVRIPEAMAQIGMDKFTVTATGTEISVKNHLKATISEERRPKAHDWLREAGHAAVIKNVVQVGFGREQDEDAQAFIEFLGTEMPDNDVRQQESVPNPTLVKLIKALLAEGVEVPLALFGVHEFKKASVKEKKKD